MDVGLLRRFKATRAWAPPAEETRHLRALLKRRDLLVSDATREKNHLEKYRATHTPEVIIVSAENMLARLDDELAEIELMLKQHVESHICLKEDYGQCCQRTDSVYDGAFEMLQWLLPPSAIPPAPLLTV